MKFEEIKELIRLINDTDTTYFELHDGEVDLKISKLAEMCRETDGGAEHSGAVATVSAPVGLTPPSNEAAVSAVDAAPEAVLGSYVTSPIVGTFFDKSAPTNAPFVKLHDNVKPGDVLCIIEAMKVMNEIVCEFEGEVLEICAKNEQLVEFGQQLFRIG